MQENVMPTYRVFVERPVYERGFYEVEAASKDEAYFKAKGMFEVSDPDNMEVAHGVESELCDAGEIEEVNEVLVLDEPVDEAEPV
jgi:hypothetical protein